LNALLEVVKVKDTHLELKKVMKSMWNRRADSYDKAPGHGIHWEWEKYAWMCLLRDVLGDENLYVLDVGTGTGFLALLLAEMGYRVVGVDISGKMLKRNREKARKLKLDNVEFRIADAEELPFSDDSFDAIVSRHVVWALPDPERAYAEWKRVLRPRGKIVIIDGGWNKLSLRREVWRFFSQLFILLTEKRNPWIQWRHRRLYERLPMRQRRRPEADIELLTKFGLRVVGVRKIDIPYWSTLLDYLKYGYHRGQRFLLVAVKPVD
jgi:ubiquinone/menaquinone biosynthesis C-methylase UbiE